MKVRLICSADLQKNIIKVLNKNGIEVVADANVSLVEKGMPVPEKGVSIIYSPDNLTELIEFFTEIRLQNSLTRESVLVGKKQDSYELIKMDEVCFFEAEGNNTYCQAGEKRFEVKKKLYEIENELSGRCFFRVNKSYLVNLLQVSEIIPWFGGRLLLKFKEITDEVEVSRNNTAEFKKYLGI